MSFKKAIEEMKSISDAKLQQEEYLKNLNTTVIRISSAISSGQAHSWKHVESLIHVESELFGLDPEHIRNQLKEMV